MKTLLKAILALLGAAALVLGLGAAPASANHVVITLDADGTSLPVASAAADWSKNTNVTVVAGDCTGPRCVHFKLDSTPCDINSPLGNIGGCAYGLADGSCQVEVDAELITYPGREWLDDLITKHEAGHCIFRFSGKVSQSFHIADPRALMSATQPSLPSKQDTMLTSIDRSFTRTLYN